MADDAIRVLIVDDHAELRELLKEHLNTEPDIEVVADTGDGSEGIRLACDVAPTVAVIDVSMRDPDGVSVCRSITENCPGVRPIAFTWHSDRAFLPRLLDAGAKGFVQKRSAATELVAAIRAVAAGDVYVDSALRAGPTVAAKDHPPTVLPPGALDSSEEQVLRLLASGRSNQEIAAELHLSVDDVASLKSSAMKKAQLTGRVHVVRYAQAAGWLKR